MKIDWRGGTDFYEEIEYGCENEGAPAILSRISILSIDDRVVVGRVI